MAKLILGFTGEMVSGKGTAAKYVSEKYKANSYRFSTILRDILTRVHLEHSRENMQKISEALRKTFGEDVMAKSMALDVQNDQGEVVVIDGIRRLPDIKYLKELPHFKLVYIEADIEVKHRRLLERNENTDDANKTLEQFRKEHEAEAETQIRDLKRHAQYLIDNNGTLEDLHAQVDKVVEENL